MKVKKLARCAGIATTTINSIIQRDAAIRSDATLKISHIIDIPINSICKNNPYDDMETFPELPFHNSRISASYKKHISPTAQLKYRNNLIIRSYQ